MAPKAWRDQGGLDFNKSNVWENANGCTLEILISEYQIAPFTPPGRYVAFQNEIIQPSGFRHVSPFKLCHQILSDPDVHQARA